MIGLYEPEAKKLICLTLPHTEFGKITTPYVNMKKILYLILLFGLSGTIAVSQHVYTVSGGEMIFQSALVEQYNDDVPVNVRFSLFFHAGQFVHVDFGNTVGFFSGLGLRNIGFITEQNDIRIKYRSYNLGIPLAFKIGSFSHNTFLFAGAEYEWMFHFKQKVITGGEKTKYNKWFSNRTPAFIPSVFAGIQFPKGPQIKFRYYLDDFLNHNYSGSGYYSDYTSFTKTQVWYISLSFMLNTDKIKNMDIRSADYAGL